MDGLPYPLRFLTKLVFDILPAALASVIGGFLFAQYHVSRPPAPVAAVEIVAPEKMEEAMRMVREEHNLIVDFLKGQQAADAKRHASFDAARAKAAAESREAAQREALAREAANREAVQKRRDAEQARLKPADGPSPGKPAIEVATIEPVAPPQGPAVATAAADGPRPPAEIPNAPRRAGPIDATIMLARDVTGRAVSTVLEFPGWLGDRILGSPTQQSPMGRMSSTEW